jgi:hypothetical protein
MHIWSVLGTSPRKGRNGFRMVNQHGAGPRVRILLRVYITTGALPVCLVLDKLGVAQWLYIFSTVLELLSIINIQKAFKQSCTLLAYFPGNWENYHANQFISNLPIPMPNHIMANHIKSHVHSFPY